MYKRLTATIIILLATCNIVIAQNNLPVNTTIVAAAAPIQLSAAQKDASLATYFDCIKNYALSSEILFYMCLSAINEANYQIQEIQFKSGSIIFKAYSKDFILMVATKDNKNSYLKILPCDNTYNFSTVLVDKIFGYLDINQKTTVQYVL